MHQNFVHYPDLEFSELKTGDKHHSITAALLAFDACRSQAVQITGFSLRVSHVNESEVIKREPLVQMEMQHVHDILTESGQLLVYRFYLTAVHRNSIMTTRFHPSVMSSPERSAAIEAEYDEISHQLNELVKEVASASLDTNSAAAHLHATAFLSAMTWWIHGRQDVVVWEFDRMGDPLAMLLLGRGPDVSERVSRQVYEQAVTAEVEYRNYVAETAAKSSE